MEKIFYKFITKWSIYYPKAVNLRYNVFYKPSGLTIEAALDDQENMSLHLVAIYQNNVVGYIRLTIQNNIAQISQFVIDETMRGKASIAITLFKMIENKARDSMVQKIIGEIRLPVSGAAKRFGFIVSDEIFPSKKTGIPHRRIEKVI